MDNIEKNLLKTIADIEKINTIQYNTSHYYNFWLFFHCKTKKLFWTFKRFLWRLQKLNIEEITL